ncbi:MAG: HD-GYP domain-containing protein [Chloroflexi bacterium]|nr:HD-GYP domain-containing protein [Chloroflexota bacterium]
MSNLRPSARLFLWLVILTAGALLVLRGFEGIWPSETQAQFTLLSLAIIGTVADRLGINLQTGFLHHNKVTVTITTFTTFALVMLFGPVSAVWAGVASSLLTDILARRVWYKTLFNASCVVVMINVTWVVYTLINDGSGVPLSSLANGLALLAASLTYLLTNTAVVCTIVALAEGVPPWQVWRTMARSLSVQMVALFPLGTLVVVVYHQTVWGLPLLVVPIYLAQYSFQAYRRLMTQSQRTMEMLAAAVDQRDPYTYRHSARVAEFSETMALRMNLDMADVESIKGAALVHDLGKVGIESSILLKPGPLDARERERMQEHPAIGANIVGQLAVYEHMREMVACHQERWDGKGYPGGLKGEDVPQGARIIAVADAYEAMTSDRPYRKALPHEVAIAELRRGRGTQFDPEVVEAFLAVLAEAEESALKDEPERPVLKLEAVPNRRAVS